MNPAEDQKNNPVSPTSRKIIQPLHPEEVKTYIEENTIPSQIAPQTKLSVEQPQLPTDKAPSMLSTVPENILPLQKSRTTINFKKIFTYLSLLLAVLLIAFVIFSLKRASDYTIIEANGPNFTYSLDFAKNTLQTNSGGDSILKGKDLHSNATILIALGPAVQSDEDCSPGSSSTITIISSENINGEKHNLCYSSALNTYAADFRGNGTWYAMGIRPQNGTAKISVDTAKTIVRSIKIH